MFQGLYQPFARSSCEEEELFVVKLLVQGSTPHADLPQGGLELPCKLKFSAASKEITKIRRLLTQVPKCDEVTNSNTSESLPKLTTVEVKSCCDSVKEPPASSEFASVEMKYGCDSVNETPACSELASVEMKYGCDSVNDTPASSKLASAEMKYGCYSVSEQNYHILIR